MSYSCKCRTQCNSFREHVGNGPYIPSSATPSRKPGNASNIEKEQRWEREEAAYRRLDAQGYQLQSAENADVIESRATQEIELKTGKLYGDQAKTFQKVADEAFSE